ncbi:MAG: GNAT family N-acetyltransferase [Eubacterium sp.]|nr:GNAT family N-acetyltransferase [Eubacterium sp.]
MKEKSFFEGADSESFEAAYAIIEASFPRSERRSRKGQQALLEEAAYELLTLPAPDGGVLAVLGVWHLGDFDYIEHAAVSVEARGGGIGSRIFEEFFKINGGRMVLLEVEPPEETDAKRRIRFYERLGFYLNPYDYCQPSLGEGKPALPLQIMTYPEAIDQGRFEDCRSELMRTVYHKDRID